VFAAPQHLLKNLKSVVLRHLIIPTFISDNQNLPSQHVSRQYVKDLWQYDKSNTSGMKFLPHLKQTDIFPNHYAKMNQILFLKNCSRDRSSS
jgi:hypothetical protein